MLSGQITTELFDFIASCINFTISLFLGWLSNINTLSSAEIFLAVRLRFASPDAKQLDRNRLSMGPSTIFTV